MTHIFEPQTLAWAMQDSPAGLAAWMLQRRRNWSDCDGDVERRFTKDALDHQLRPVLAHRDLRRLGPLLRRLVRRAVDAGARPPADAAGADGHRGVPARAAARAARARRAGGEPGALDPDGPRRPLRPGGGAGAGGRGPPGLLPPPARLGVTAELVPYSWHELSRGSRSMGILDGKVAVITGAGSGMGKASVKVFVREGAEVVAADISGAEQDTAEEVGGDVLAVHCDVTKEEDIERTVAAAVEEFGRLDVMLNVAGIARGDADRRHHRGALPPADGRRPVRRDLRDEARDPRHARQRRRWRHRELVVARRPRRRRVHDACTTRRSTAWWAPPSAQPSSTAPNNIRVNAVCPGFIHSEIMGAHPEWTPGILEKAALGRGGQPSEVAEVAAFLASDRASFVTGAASRSTAAGAPSSRDRSGPLRRDAVARVEDARLLTGHGTFVDDIVLPGMLHASFVRSPYARARIRGHRRRRGARRCPACTRCSPPPT